MLPDVGPTDGPIAEEAEGRRWVEGGAGTSSKRISLCGQTVSAYHVWLIYCGKSITGYQLSCVCLIYCGLFSKTHLSSYLIIQLDHECCPSRTPLIMFRSFSRCAAFDPDFIQRWILQRFLQLFPSPLAQTKQHLSLVLFLFNLPQVDCVVIGAGIAGVTSARAMVEAGRRPCGFSVGWKEIEWPQLGVHSCFRLIELQRIRSA